MSLTKIKSSIIEDLLIKSSNLEEDISIVGTLDVAGTTSITGDIEVAGEITSSTGIVGRGTLPIGTILTWVPGYMNSGQTVYTSTSITLPEEWKECDGTEQNDGESPIFNGAGRYLPKLDDDRFLMGNTSVGDVGGENDGHYHGLSGTALTAAGQTGGSHRHWFIADWGSGSGDMEQVGWHPTYARTNYTDAASHTMSASNVTGSIGLSTGFDGNTVGSNRPQYLSCKYIMRVK